MTIQSLPMTDLVLHKQGSVEAHEATYQNKVFLSYVVNTETHVLKLSTVRTVQASRGQGLAKAALQGLCDMADAQNLSIGLTAQPTRSGQDAGLTEADLVKMYVKLGFDKRGQIKGKTGFHQLMTREAK